MVNVVLREQEVSFETLGWSRLWTFHDKVVVPRSAIRGVRRASPGIGRGWWKGWRMPGSHVPGVVVAGSFRKQGEWTFWDVRGSGDRAIEVDLEGVRFSQLVVDVADPDLEVRRLDGVIQCGSGSIDGRLQAHEVCSR